MDFAKNCFYASISCPAQQMLKKQYKINNINKA